MKIFIKRIFVLTPLLVVASAVLVVGCHTAGRHHTGTSQPESKQKMAKGGAQLWGDNCARCHNFRSPASFGDAEWEVAVHHMRVRGNLTAEEHRKILEFLKSAN